MPSSSLAHSLTLIRRRSPASIIVVALALATVLITATLPLRWNGFVDEDGINWTPLRPITLSEAATLLRRQHAVITHLTPSVATLATPREVNSGQWQSTPTANLFIDTYFSEYQLVRSELEQALGHTLQPSEVQSYRSVNSPTPTRSFRPDDLARYVLVESTLLTFLFAAPVLLLRVITNPWHVAYPFPLVCVLFQLSVLVYSPGFADHDYFGQRILVEWLYVRFLNPVLIVTLALSCVGLVHDVLAGMRVLRRRLRTM